MYCTKGKDGKRQVIAIRDTRAGGGYCSKACASINQYKKRYTGSLQGRATQEAVKEKMQTL